MNQKFIFASPMKLFNSIFSVIVLLALASCEQKCDEPDIERINSVHIQLKEGGSDGFTEGELNDIFFIRYVPNSNPLVADTSYPNGFFPEGDGRFLINDSYPFRNEEPPYWVVYGYEIVEPNSGFRTRIQDIELEGMYDGDCGYNNIKKTFTVDSIPVDMSGSQDFYVVTKE